MSLVASLILEDGRTWGESATDFQWIDVQAVLDPEAPPYHFITRPRGASKTTDLAAVAIAFLIDRFPSGAKAHAVASDRDQSRLLLDAIGGFVARTPGLAGALRVEAWRVVNSITGASLEIIAADGPSAFGLLPHLLIADEIAIWPDTPSSRLVWEAVYSAAVKVPGARLVILTSAGDPSHWSKKILDHARSHRRWRVNETAGPCPWIDPAALEDQRALLTESQYARLHLNEWTEGEERLTTDEDLRAAVVLDGPQESRRGVKYVIGVDVGLKNDRTAVVVAHTERLEPLWVEGRQANQLRRVVLDRLGVWQGSRLRPVKLAEVEEYIAQASRSFNKAPVIFDPFQAIGSMQRLQAIGIRCVEFTFSSASVGHLATTLHLLLRNRALALPDDPDLIEELAAVRLRETSPGTFRMDHDPGKHDDRAIALALAAQHLLTKRPPARTRQGQLSYSTRRGVGSITWNEPDEDRHYESKEQREIWRGIQASRRNSRSGGGR